MLPYMRGTRILRLLGDRYYLKNYFAKYRYLTRSRKRVKLASPACSGLGIIYIIILPCIHVYRDPEYVWNALTPPTWG